MKKKLFLILQSVLCLALAPGLAAGTLGIYREGSARQAADPLSRIYTPEAVAAALRPVLPLLLIVLLLSALGLVLGIRDENADKPVRDEKLLRDLGSIRDRAVHGAADRKTFTLRTAILAAALLLIILGILNGGLDDVLAKGATICTECVGLG